MKTRRLIHTTKDTFFEVFWMSIEVELVAGAIGTKGRARRVDFSLPSDADAFVEAEIAKRLKQGFVEVSPEDLPAQQAKTAPRAKAAPELLAEILATPDDDAPRLVYADYLSNQGDPLGELVVVQCERARLSRWDPKQRALADREEQLIMTFRRRWTGEIDDDVRFVWRRGFIERLRIERVTSSIAGVLDRAMAIAPLLDTLELPGELSPMRVGSSASLRRLVGLRMRGRLHAPLGDWIGHGDLANVVRLALQSATLGRIDLTRLVVRPWRTLDLSDNALGSNGVRVLLERCASDVLEALDIDNCGIGNDGLRYIVAREFPRLRALELSESRMTHAGLAMLADARGLRNVRSLGLGGNDLRGDGFVKFLASDNWPGLVELGLGATAISDDEVGLVAASPLAQRLVELDLGHNPITDRGAASMLAMSWPALERVALDGIRLAPEIKKALRLKFASVRLSKT